MSQFFQDPIEKLKLDEKLAKEKEAKNSSVNLDSEDTSLVEDVSLVCARIF
jgi:low affinity Fe/Cu permease